ncbi:hypothetical protein NQZ68_034377 [Dissostichus eleginoides]|nr:hypothetical protein NQZ68_034377 [Dissostichus eleginoides]
MHGQTLPPARSQARCPSRIQWCEMGGPQLAAEPRNSRAKGGRKGVRGGGVEEEKGCKGCMDVTAQPLKGEAMPPHRSPCDDFTSTLLVPIGPPWAAVAEGKKEWTEGRRAKERREKDGEQREGGYAKGQLLCRVNTALLRLASTGESQGLSLQPGSRVLEPWVKGRDPLQLQRHVRSGKPHSIPCIAPTTPPCPPPPSPQQKARCLFTATNPLTQERASPEQLISA